MNFDKELTLLSGRDLDCLTALNPLRSDRKKYFGITDFAVITGAPRVDFKN